LISLDGARLSLEAAADARDNDNPDWPVFAAPSLAFAGPALPAVSIEPHRALGAIGYAEEHEAPRHFRRVHADLARFGGAPGSRAARAVFVLGRAAGPPSPQSAWVPPPTPSARRCATGSASIGRRKSQPRI